MSTKSSRSAKVGESVEVAEGAEVVRPDGRCHKVSGSSYVLDEPGTFIVAGDEVTAK